jgi:hypothetical protein
MADDTRPGAGDHERAEKQQAEDGILVTFELTFRGQAGPATRAQFDDCQVIVSPGMTTLRAELPDQAALVELIQRVTSLRLELILMQRVASTPAP